MPGKAIMSLLVNDDLDNIPHRPFGLINYYLNIKLSKRIGPEDITIQYTASKYTPAYFEYKISVYHNGFRHRWEKTL